MQALQRGAENFLTKPVDLDHLRVAAERGLEKARLRQLARYMRERRGIKGVGALLGTSPAMRELAHQIELLTSSDRTTVLLLGEQGTAKGQMAYAMHAMSNRADKPFIEVACAGALEGALDVELFGDEYGGAREAPTRRLGLAEVADQGALLLDEIAALELPIQGKLLRLLEAQKFRRVGGVQDVSVDVRVIVTSSRDLVEEVQAGRFARICTIGSACSRSCFHHFARVRARISSRSSIASPASCDASFRTRPPRLRRRARSAPASFVAREHPRAAQRARARNDRGPRIPADLDRASASRCAPDGQLERGESRSALAARCGACAHRANAARAQRKSHARRPRARDLARDLDQQDQGVSARSAGPVVRGSRRVRPSRVVDRSYPEPCHPWPTQYTEEHNDRE